ncbi:MAG: hypothetical protein M3Z03_08315, partial [Actinomycetota bacterium]|nr:hypothetical protein [Actinomycetota bacterium]
LHVERLAAGVELKAAVDIGGTTTWAEGHDDWWYEVDEPFERSRWAWRSGDLAIDVRLASTLPPIDHAAALATLQLAGSERDHYEAIGRFSGTVSVAGATVPVDGLFVRDHTWGAREYHRFGPSWWWPTCFDGGAAYAGGVAVALEDRTVGYGLVADEHGVAATPVVELEVDGQAAPGGYAGTTIRYVPEGREPVALTSVTRRHLCTTFPGFGADRQWNEAYSTCRWGPREGFGSRELGC